MTVIGDIYLGKLFISFYYFLGKQAQKSNILCLINAAGGGGGGGHKIIFDISDGAMRYFGGNTMGHEKKQGFWRKVSGPD